MFKKVVIMYECSDTMDKYNLKEVYPVLRLLKSVKPVTRSALLRTLNSSTRQCLYACITNCLKNKTLKKKTRQQLSKNLKRHSKNLRFLSTLGDTPKKKEILMQSGGALPAILAAVLPLITGLFSSAVAK